MKNALSCIEACQNRNQLQISFSSKRYTSKALQNFQSISKVFLQFSVEVLQ